MSVAKHLQDIEAELKELKAHHAQHECDYKTLYKNAQSDEQELLRLRRLLHNLTPGGANFFADPKLCFHWVQNRISNLIHTAAMATAQREEVEIERDTLLTQIGTLEKALRFYANPDHYEGQNWMSAVDFDKGDCARAILETDQETTR